MDGGRGLRSVAAGVVDTKASGSQATAPATPPHIFPATAPAEVAVAASEETISSAAAVADLTPASAVQVRSLIAEGSDHPGAGAVLVCGAFPSSVLSRLNTLRLSLPPTSHRPTAVRRFYDDRSGFGPDHDSIIGDEGGGNGDGGSEGGNGGGGDSREDGEGIGWVSAVVMAALAAAGLHGRYHAAMPFWRFIEYGAGGCMAPHTDGSNTHPETGRRTTHTLLLYLTDCAQGGETALLEDRSAMPARLACVRPRRGDMLVFPHKCPHEGCAVGADPKIALRGELIAAAAAAVMSLASERNPLATAAPAAQ